MVSDLKRDMCCVVASIALKKISARSKIWSKQLSGSTVMRELMSSVGSSMSQILGVPPATDRALKRTRERPPYCVHTWNFHSVVGEHGDMHGPPQAYASVAKKLRPSKSADLQ